MEPDALRQAIALIKSGDLKEGQALLLKLVEQNPAVEAAWMWLAVTTDEANKRRYYMWRALRLNPQNRLAQTAIKDGLQDRQELLQSLEVEDDEQPIETGSPPNRQVDDHPKMSWPKAIAQFLIQVFTYPVTLLLLAVVVIVAFASSSFVSAKLPFEIGLADTATPSPTVTLLASPTQETPTLQPTSVPSKTPLPTQTPTPVPTETPVPTQTPTQAPSETPLPTQPPTATFDPNDWESLPVVPKISDTALEIYRKGQELGNRPFAFSKVGDCNTLSVRFLTYFDLGSSAYNLEDYTYLGALLDYFKGSFHRQSIAVGDGFNTSAVLSPFRADPNYCHANESPLTCEYRLQKPSFALIALGTDDYLAGNKFEANLRQIVRTTIDLGIVPILATKADNANQLNYNPIIAKVAYDFDVPLWNVWAAFQPLPQGGLVDNMHPSGEFAAFDFSSENLSRWGWTERNLTALQALFTAWTSVNQSGGGTP